MTGVGLLLAVPAVILDLETSPIKDQRNSTCRPDLGYAGCLTEVSLYNEAFGLWAYGAGIKETENALVDCGARFVRQWNALEEWQRGMAGEWNRSDPKVHFGLWKKLGIRILLTLELYSVFTGKKLGKKTDDIEVVKKTVGRFVEWLVRNKFKDVVAGFELGNEAYFGNEPEWYAGRCEAVIPEILKIWPEAKIGIPIAEYRAGDPDLDVVRKRLGEKKMMAGGGEFEINRCNQWSGRFVTALSNQIDKVTHVIYHFYGADAAYGCSASGFGRVHNFAKIYPQIAGKRVWITEWRERSDEDIRCHQMFFSTLWKSHYMLLALAQPNVDGINQHCLGGYAGGLNISMNCSCGPGQPWWSGFVAQSDPSQGYNFYHDPDGGFGKHRYQVGPAGPLYKMYTDALLDHPIIQEHGTLGGQGSKASCWASALYYESANRQRNVLNRGGAWKDVPPIRGNVEWIAALNPAKSSLAMLMVNTTDEPVSLPLKVRPKSFGQVAKVRILSCPKELVYHHSIPGEDPLWSTDAYSLTTFSGKEGSIEVPSMTILTAVVPLK